MSRLCPINCLTIAVNTTDNLKGVPIGYDCPEDKLCAWWDEYTKTCGIMGTTNLWMALETLFNNRVPALDMGFD